MIKKIKSVSEQILEVFEQNRNPKNIKKENLEFIDFNNAISEMLIEELNRKKENNFIKPMPFSLVNQ